MKILALETSAKAVSAAVSEDGKILCSGYQDTGLTHSRTLMPIVEHILKNTGLSVADMDAIAVAAGPGSFTGIRIGVAAAKGLAFAAGLPAVGVSTLEAMARNAAAPDGLILCAMDARHQQIYNAVFRVQNGVLTRLTPDRPIALADLATELAGSDEPKTVAGDGAVLCRDYLTEHGIPCAGHASRQITLKDYANFDLLIGMDEENLRNMRRVFSGDPEGKISLLLDHTGRGGNVADPWYTGDFDATWRDVNDGCRALLQEFREEIM